MPIPLQCHKKEILKPVLSFLLLACLHIPVIMPTEAAAIFSPRRSLPGFSSSASFASEMFSTKAFYQADVEVTGVVRDQNQQPIPGVTVSVQGTAIGTATDMDGRYSLTVPEGATLVFSFIGFNTHTVRVGAQNVIDVVLLEDISSLEEVVVVGYAEQRKVSVTGAVASVNTNELRQSSSASLANALAGRLSGLTSIQSGGGQPGRDDATMYLRGVATTNGRSPLILIDGVPRDNIRTIDANEVESVSILKDASATAVFPDTGSSNYSQNSPLWHLQSAHKNRYAFYHGPPSLIIGDGWKSALSMALLHLKTGDLSKRR